MHLDGILKTFKLLEFRLDPIRIFYQILVIDHYPPVYATVAVTKLAETFFFRLFSLFKLFFDLVK